MRNPGIDNGHLSDYQKCSTSLYKLYKSPKIYSKERATNCYSCSLIHFHISVDANHLNVFSTISHLQRNLNFFTNLEYQVCMQLCYYHIISIASRICHDLQMQPFQLQETELILQWDLHEQEESCFCSLPYSIIPKTATNRTNQHILCISFDAQ